ncbi:MAG: FMN-binding glutamate synthase family protein [Elusimicrobia bacterium]|nr:FMN-binding glutamate synthase family protein [Elusimicrobiota bacterium]
MSLIKQNASAATLTKNRTEGSVCISGLCATCVDGCIGMCEVGRSAIRSHEVIYPQPFGMITTAAEKRYPVDMSHFNIMGSCVGAHGMPEDSDKAIFPNVNLETRYGAGTGIKVKLPIVFGGMGSTNIAANNWEGLAAGAAVAGVVLTVGENVVGMDPESKIVKGRVVDSPELARRVKLFRDWQRGGYGAVVIQANVEDTRLGIQEYSIEKLGVKAVELKWGQGAKDIGGEVKIKQLKKAQLLKDRGYVVLPDPYDKAVIAAFEKGTFTEFERHSRVGMVSEESFMKRVAELRKAGAKWIQLKTGAYRPVDLARAVKYASMAKLDLLTVDAAGGGTGMSPWKMMNEWGLPPVEMFSLMWKYCDTLAKRGEYVPPIAVASGFVFEDSWFKGLAMGAPYVKLIEMARAPLTAAMVAKTIGKKLEQGTPPVFVERFGKSIDEVFVEAGHLRQMLGKDFDRLPAGAIGVYSYLTRCAQGMRQLMAGARKFSLEHIKRDDICALTRTAADISGIQYVMDVDKEEAEKVLAGK